MTMQDFLDTLSHQVVHLESRTGYARGYVFAHSTSEAWLITNSHLYPKPGGANMRLALRINAEPSWRKLDTMWLRPVQPGRHPDFLLAKIPWSAPATYAPVDFTAQEASVWEGYVFMDTANRWRTLSRMEGYATGQLGFVLGGQEPLTCAPVGWSGSPIFKIRRLASGGWTQRVVGTIAYYDPAQSALVAVALQPELAQIRQAMVCYDVSQYALDHTDNDTLLADYKHACADYQAGNSVETHFYANDWVPLKKLKPIKQAKGSSGIIAYAESNMVRCHQYCRERSLISQSAPSTVEEMMDQVKALFTKVRDTGRIVFTRDSVSKAVRFFATPFLRMDVHLSKTDIRFEIQDNYWRHAKYQNQPISRIFACSKGKPPQEQKEWQEDVQYAIDTNDLLESCESSQKNKSPQIISVLQLGRKTEQTTRVQKR